MKRLAVLISGQGRNLQALIEACADGRVPAQIAVVISNRADAGGLERARQAGLPVRVIPHGQYAGRELFDAALAAEIDQAGAEIVVLAGFMRVLTAGFVQRYLGRLINIHPSLLPRHPGLHTHQRALDAGDPVHGATVHFVTPDLDGGPAIIQGQFMVRPDDTSVSLAERVMQEVELRIYPQAVAWMARDLLELSGQQVRFKGDWLQRPLQLEHLESAFQ